MHQIKTLLFHNPPLMLSVQIDLCQKTDCFFESKSISLLLNNCKLDAILWVGLRVIKYDKLRGVGHGVNSTVVVDTCYPHR